jgi:lipopolysaccharide/colanic/teichoic acid biosynthesis glycosyltransferase
MAAPDPLGYPCAQAAVSTLSGDRTRWPSRREPDFGRWVASDLEYIDRSWFWLDREIIALTVPAVLAGEGR